MALASAMYGRTVANNLALRQYQLCFDALSEVLGVPPMPETTSFYKQIRNGDRV